jgi:para-nitrobenzyl esterase
MKHALIATAMLSLALPAAAETAGFKPDGPKVTVAQGTVEGVTDYGVDSFKGLPFAAPPVGQLRWRAPQPAAAWSGVRIADHFAPDCMQQAVPYDDAPLTVKSSEDCLYLNVWRPAGSEGRRLPVMVWIYGGGFVSGGTSPAIYDGAAFARDGLVFVSVNYRLGRFGFFGFPALTRENADRGDLGDYAFMDQIAALKWVRANIAAFGGDPGNVTLFGESAGGFSMHALLTSPEAKGLFARAIIQSGAGRLDPDGERSLGRDGKKPSAETVGVHFAEAHGIAGTDAAALAALRALPADAVRGDLSLATESDEADTFTGEIVDGHILPEPPATAEASGIFNASAIMVGANTADISRIDAASKDALFATFGPLAAQAHQAYDPDGTYSLDALNAAVGADALMIEPARATAQRAAAHGITVFEYRFAYTASQKKPQSPFGAPHASELPFVFSTLEARYGEAATAEDHQAARAMHAAWVAFAKGEAPWTAWTPSSDAVMVFTPDAQAKVLPDPLKARLDVTQAKAEAK